MLFTLAPIWETKSPFRFCRKGHDCSNYELELINQVKREHDVIVFISVRTKTAADLGVIPAEFSPAQYIRPKVILNSGRKLFKIASISCSI